jgi:hypothetical protein
MIPKHPSGPPMDLGNMREQGVHHLIAYCFNDSCRHQALIDVSSYPGDTEVPWFSGKVVCAKCGARGRRIDVRPNWKEAPGMATFECGRQIRLDILSSDALVGHLIQQDFPDRLWADDLVHGL